jgi:DNA-binding PadR family transcriptional regulator
MNNPLAQSEFYILLSLAIKERHGYEIMKQVEQDSHGKVLLGPGTLYGSIKRMLQSDLIEEVSGNDPRRKYYTLTEKGRKVFAHELERYNDAVELAKRSGLFPRLGLHETVS